VGAPVPLRVLQVIRALLEKSMFQLLNTLGIVVQNSWERVSFKQRALRCIEVR
jgi:hypothetical protein